MDRSKEGKVTELTSSWVDYFGGKKLEQDTLLSSPTGTTFIAPKDWYASFRKDLWVLEDPERDLVLSLVEKQEGDLVDAAQKAWSTFRPGFSLGIEDVFRSAGKNGWDEAVRVNYLTPTAEKRFVAARGRRKGNTWWFELVDGKAAAVDRRWAQMDLVITSLKVPGIEPEAFAGKKANPLDEMRLQALEHFIEESRLLCRLPGVAVAIVQDGKVVFEKGFGVREKDGREAVTPSTLFAIGSISKQLTTLMMARLVDKGVLDWETPILKLRPSFRLGDEEMAQKLTLRHTVSASTGLPRQDMEWIFKFKGVTPEESLARMAAMKPTTAFGEVYQYSNPMVAAGGYIAAHGAFPALSLDQAFDQAIQSEVFGPLGMVDTTTRKNSVEKKEHCSPHGKDLAGEVFPIQFEIEGDMLMTIQPSGGIWSNVRDMARIVMMENSRGLNPGGGRYLSEKNLLKRREPQVKIDDKTSYGLGLMLGEDCGIKVVSHSGGTFGFITHMFFLPDHDTGAVILTNVLSQQACFFFGEVQRRFMELLFDGRDKAAEDLALEIREWDKMEKANSAKVELKPGREWFSKLTGDYFNESLGKVTVRLEGDEGIFGTTGWKTSLGRKVEEDGTVKAVLTSPPNAGVDFILGEEQGRLNLTLETSQQKYVFEKTS